MSYALFTSLLMKSAKIQKEIEAERSTRWPNWMRLLRLKKIRLKIKDRLLEIAQHKTSGRKTINLRKAAVLSGTSRHYPRMYFG